MIQTQNASLFFDAFLLHNLTTLSTYTTQSIRVIVIANANVIFIMAEVCLLGGLPIVMEHMSIVPLYCLSYTFFSWFMANRWLPNGGPQYLYFFLDTTLGWTTSIALLLLCIVLLTFYIFFAKMSTLGDNYLGEDLLVRLVATVGLSSLVCRFRN